MLQQLVVTIGADQGAPFEVGHGWGFADVIVQLSDAETGEVFDADVVLHPGLIRIKIGEGVPRRPIRVVIIG